MLVLILGALPVYLVFLPLWYTPWRKTSNVTHERTHSDSHGGGPVTALGVTGIHTRIHTQKSARIRQVPTRLVASESSNFYLHCGGVELDHIDGWLVAVLLFKMRKNMRLEPVWWMVDNTLKRSQSRRSLPVIFWQCLKHQ